MRCICCLALIAASCAGPADTLDQVHDLRLLALKADPPEVRVVEGEQPAPVQITALLADPDGGGRSVHYRYSTCAQLDTDANQCLTTSPGYALLGEGDVTPDGSSAEPATMLNASADLLVQTASLDPNHGFGGIWVPVQIELTAGAEDVVGFKRAVFTVAGTDAGAAIDQNPVLQGLSLQSADWSQGQLLALPSVDGGVPIAPKFDPALEVSYQVPTLQGGDLTLQESWMFNFFCTAGQFSTPSTGGANGLTGASGDVQSYWSAKSTDAAQTVTFWVVVNDGRGGTAWLSRQGSWTPF